MTRLTAHPEREEYVAEVIASWRRRGGDPDIGFALPALLREAGLETCRARRAAG